MNFIHAITSYQIKKINAQPRKKKFVTLSQAQNIGIIFEATHHETFDLVKAFMQQLKEYNKNIHAIGFVDQKYTPNYSYIKTDIDLFDKKGLDFFQRPVSPYINSFCEDEKSLLIDINLTEKMPLRYIAAKSKASCKVGLHTPQNETTHDILLSLNEKKETDFYLQQVKKYIAIL
ncbi:MAG: hypothetical protein JST67_04640 [Bacteroidetes bacterium]|nr:hypothetical protein [Bacteroidota bacterium]